MTKNELLVAWEALWDLSEELFDPESFVNSTIGALASDHPECIPPPRQDLAEAAVLLCQTIKGAIAVAEGIAERLGADNSDS